MFIFAIVRFRNLLKAIYLFDSIEGALTHARPLSAFIRKGLFA
jgi:hypothetical protein